MLSAISLFKENSLVTSRLESLNEHHIRGKNTSLPTNIDRPCTAYSAVSGRIYILGKIGEEYSYDVITRKYIDVPSPLRNDALNIDGERGETHHFNVAYIQQYNVLCSMALLRTRGTLLFYNINSGKWFIEPIRGAVKPVYEPLLKSYTNTPLGYPLVASYADKVHVYFSSNRLHLIWDHRFKKWTESETVSLFDERPPIAQSLIVRTKRSKQSGGAPVITLLLFIMIDGTSTVKTYETQNLFKTRRSSVMNVGSGFGNDIDSNLSWMKRVNQTFYDDNRSLYGFWNYVTHGTEDVEMSEMKTVLIENQYILFFGPKAKSIKRNASDLMTGAYGESFGGGGHTDSANIISFDLWKNGFDRWYKFGRFTHPFDKMQPIVVPLNHTIHFVGNVPNYNHFIFHIDEFCTHDLTITTYQWKKMGAILDHWCHNSNVQLPLTDKSRLFTSPSKVEFGRRNPVSNLLPIAIQSLINEYFGHWYISFRFELFGKRNKDPISIHLSPCFHFIDVIQHLRLKLENWKDEFHICAKLSDILPLFVCDVNAADNDGDGDSKRLPKITLEQLRNECGITDNDGDGDNESKTDNWVEIANDYLYELGWRHFDWKSNTRFVIEFSEGIKTWPPNRDVSTTQSALPNSTPNEFYTRWPLTNYFDTPKHIRIGDIIDCWNESKQEWFESMVRYKNEKIIFIHYLWLDSSNDECIESKDWETRVANRGRFSLGPKIPPQLSQWWLAGRPSIWS